MLILNPAHHETIWGGNRILHNVDGKKIGHLYMVNGHASMSNPIMNGIEKGRLLKDVFAEKKCEWNLSEYEEFPLTIALVDASDNLSIQVHPDDKVAKELEGKKIGKKESWIFLETPKSGWIYAGCSAQTNDDVNKAVSEGMMEQIVGHFFVNKNDYVCISAGTLHAMTAGSLVYEIEYGSDFTYRFYDYNRVDAKGKKRELHIEKALKAMDLNVKPKKLNSNNKFFEEDVYELSRRPIVGSYTNDSSEIECISVLAGEAFLDGVSVHAGMTILIFPNERIDELHFFDAIIAKIRR